jgi:hypothetical protein
MSANGQHAVVTRTVPKAATLLTWSPFLFPHPFAAGQAIHMREDLRQLAPVLGQARLHARWRWAFGDGQTVTAVTLSAVSHRYAHPGQYHIIVASYAASYNVWLPFDSVAVTIHA